ncbi:hypothetical protein ACFCP7_20665 [Paenibacillus elgii]
MPISQIIKDIQEEFRDWTITNHDFEKDGKGVFQLFTTEQFVRVDCYGVSGDDMNKLIDILLKYDCPLYDPQVSERFDEHATS